MLSVATLGAVSRLEAGQTPYVQGPSPDQVWSVEICKEQMLWCAAAASCAAVLYNIDI